MLRLKNHEAVLEALIEQLKEFEADLNRYQTDVYLYVKNGEGSISKFTNVGGNSWLQDDHFTIYTDKEHYDKKMDALIDGSSYGSSYGWLIDELESTFNLSGLKAKAYAEITAAMDEETMEDDEIACFDDLACYDVEQWLENNYSNEIDQYYKEYFIPDCCMDGISEAAYNALYEFENNHSFVVLKNGEFYADYESYDTAKEAAEALGTDAEVDIWNDYHISEKKN